MLVPKFLLPLWIECMSIWFGLSLSYSCSDEFDCSLGGECVDSKCVCNPEWRGEDCGILNLLPATNYKAFYRATESSWGGSVLFNTNDNKYHMFVADMAYNCTLPSWQTNCRILHSVSDSPDGPYNTVDTTIPIWSCNPTIYQVPNETTFVLYHIGFGTDHGTPINCTSNYTDIDLNSIANKTAIARSRISDRNFDFNYDYKYHNKIGMKRNTNGNKKVINGKKLQESISDTTYTAPNMAVSDDLNGVFTEYNSVDGDYAFNNPGAYFDINGSVLLIYKVACENWNSTNFCRQFAVATSNSYKGPFNTIRDNIYVYGEDPYVWKDLNNNYHILFQGGNYGGGLPSYVGHWHTAYSKNGIDWKVANLTEAFNQTIELTNGSYVTVGRRERCQLLFDSDGQPTHLFNGVTLGSNDADEFSYTCVQPINTAQYIQQLY